MAKKSKKSVVKARKVKKKSWIQKFLTFPKIVVIGISVLSALTFYQVTMSSSSVMGVSTTGQDEISIISEAEAKSLAQSKTSQGYTVHQIRVFVDNKKTDGKYDIYSEECLDKDITLYVDNGNKVREFPGIWGCTELIRIKTKAREITVGLKSVSGYKFTGLTFRDQTHPNDTTRLGISKIKVKGFPTYGQYYTVIDFGVKKK